MRDGWMNVDENNTIINISGITVITVFWTKFCHVNKMLQPVLKATLKILHIYMLPVVL